MKASTLDDLTREVGQRESEEPHLRGADRQRLGEAAAELLVRVLIFRRACVTAEMREHVDVLGARATGIARLCLPHVFAPEEACPAIDFLDNADCAQCQGTGWKNGRVPRWELPIRTLRVSDTEAKIKSVRPTAIRRLVEQRWGEEVVLLRTLDWSLEPQRVSGQLQILGRVICGEQIYFAVKATKEADHG